MKILLFAASLKRESLNKKLAGNIEKILKALNIEVEYADFKEFDMPLYNFDLESGLGFPPGAIEFRRRLDNADGVIISSPEYNYAMPGHLKNAIDWASRARPMPFHAKPMLLTSASPSLIAPVRGLCSLRVPLEGIGAFVYPDIFALANAGEAFDSSGNIKDNAVLDKLSNLLKSFLSYTKALQNIS